jgi:hypothetical protein
MHSQPVKAYKMSKEATKRINLFDYQENKENNRESATINLDIHHADIERKKSEDKE